MSEQNTQGGNPGNPNNLDPAFFTCVNEYLELTNRQSKQQGLKRISVASLYAAARFNAHVYLAQMQPGDVAGERREFLDYMSNMYRRMLNEHLDGLGQERGLDVGRARLEAERNAMVVSYLSGLDPRVITKLQP